MADPFLKIGVLSFFQSTYFHTFMPMFANVYLLHTTTTVKSGTSHALPLQSPDCWAKQTPGQDVEYSYGCEGADGQHSQPGSKTEEGRGVQFRQ